MKKLIIYFFISLIITSCGTFFGENNYSGPTVTDNNSKTITNNSSYPITIIYDDGQTFTGERTILSPGDSKTFYNEN